MAFTAPCPRCRGGTLNLNEDHGHYSYSCYSCGRSWDACPAQGCPGLLMGGQCNVCTYGDAIVEFGVRRILPGGKYG